jgi:hypothetical protein
VRRALRTALAAALLAPALAAEGAPRSALSLEGALSRNPEAPRLAAGGRLAVRLAFAEAALALDFAVAEPDAEAGYRSTTLLGAGLAHDASPLVSLHALAVAGSYGVRLRDYVYGGWRSVSERALGGQLGIRLHPDARLVRGPPGISPLAGLWLTVLRVDRGSDRLRAAGWGGTLVLVGLTLGAELTGPARHPAPPLP